VRPPYLDGHNSKSFGGGVWWECGGLELLTDYATILCYLINVQCFILLGKCVFHLHTVSIRLGYWKRFYYTVALPYTPLGDEVSQSLCAHAIPPNYG